MTRFISVFGKHLKKNKFIKNTYLHNIYMFSPHLVLVDEDVAFWYDSVCLMVLKKGEASTTWVMKAAERCEKRTVSHKWIRSVSFIKFELEARPSLLSLKLLEMKDILAWN